MTSAVMTVGAHAVAGGGIPNGGALIISLLACAAVGTMIGGLRLESRSARWLGTTSALGAAQLLGHAALVVGGHQHLGHQLPGHQLHGGADFAPSPLMIATHIGAAVILGAAISAAEYLYVVCSSVLRWLRLFAMQAQRPAPGLIRRTTNIVAVQPVFTTGLGMRAPPLSLKIV